MLAAKLLSSLAGVDSLSGTDVFSANTYTGTLAVQPVVNGIDLAANGGMVWMKPSSVNSNGWCIDTVRGSTYSLILDSIGGNYTYPVFSSFNSNGFSVGTSSYANNTGVTYISWTFRKAAEFFDIVTYVGNNSTSRQISHSLGTVPELMIVKRASTTSDWLVYHSALANTKYLTMNSTITPTDSAEAWNSTTPTSAVFSVGGTSGGENNSGSITYIAYLFSTKAGISKVGTYTGNGSSQTINCGFSTGARFVLIKRTDAAGDWMVWDTARGIIAGNDPWIATNRPYASVTTDDSIDPNTSGFIVNQVAATNANVNAATYIYLAIS